MKEEVKLEFTKYEIARILGARALQIAMDAPLLIKIGKEKLEELKYDSLKIAEVEFNSGVLPITVSRPMPKKISAKLKREVEKEKLKEADKEVGKEEVKEEKTIEEEGEIMELAKPEDEFEESSEEEEGETF